RGFRSQGGRRCTGKMADKKSTVALCLPRAPHFAALLVTGCERIFRPLGMRDTAYFVPPAKIEREARAYRSEGDRLVLVDEPAAGKAGANSLTRNRGVGSSGRSRTEEEPL